MRAQNGSSRGEAPGHQPVALSHGKEKLDVGLITEAKHGVPALIALTTGRRK
jgi:hypothetical protein